MDPWREKTLQRKKPEKDKLSCIWYSSSNDKYDKYDSGVDFDMVLIHNSHWICLYDYLSFGPGTIYSTDTISSYIDHFWSNQRVHYELCLYGEFFSYLLSILYLYYIPVCNYIKFYL